VPEITRKKKLDSDYLLVLLAFFFTTLTLKEPNWYLHFPVRVRVRIPPLPWRNAGGMQNAYHMGMSTTGMEWNGDDAGGGTSHGCTTKEIKNEKKKKKKNKVDCNDHDS
jgi:hypothetical protein